MKLTKLSLVAAFAVSSAFAGGDIVPVDAPVVEESPFTFGGNIKAFYDSTSLVDAPGYLLHKDNSSAQFAVDIDMSYAFADTWKVNFGATALTTLGLEGQLVEGVWLIGDNTTGGPGVGDALWFDTLNVTGTMFDGALTTVIGRQELDTPFAFSEQWSIAPNTFDAAVAIVKPIEELSLIAAYIHDGNGNAYNTATTGGVRMLSTFRTNPGGFTGDDGYMPGLADKGAWTIAAVGTMAGVTAQAWYYDVLDVAQAVWLQADGEFSGFQIGAQYAWMDLDDVLNPAGAVESTDGWSGKLGYKMDAFNVWGAYSSVSDDGFLSIQNTAAYGGWGALSAGGQSKLYTEAWWNYGLVGNPGADTFALSASYNMGDMAMISGIELLAQYTSMSNDVSNLDMDEFTALVGGKAYGFEVQLAYIRSDYSDSSIVPTRNEDYNTVQAYITYSF